MVQCLLSQTKKKKHEAAKLTHRNNETHTRNHICTALGFVGAIPHTVALLLAAEVEAIVHRERDTLGERPRAGCEAGERRQWSEQRRESAPARGAVGTGHRAADNILEGAIGAELRAGAPLAQIAARATAVREPQEEDMA